MATPNPQKTHNTPPSHNNDTTKKDHRRPKVNSYKPDSLQKCTQTIDTIHKERIITTGKRTQMHKMATPNPQKTHNTPPHTIMTPQKKTIVALVNSSFNRIPYRNAQTSTPFTKKGS